MEGYLVSDATWNGTVPNFNWALYEQLKRLNDADAVQRESAAEAERKYAGREVKAAENRIKRMKK